MSFLKVSVVAAVVSVLVPCVLHAEDAEPSNKKVDSTEKFRELDKQDQREASVFDLPDIVLPKASAPEEGQKGEGEVLLVQGSQSNAATGKENVTELPVPVVRIGVAAAPTTLSTTEGGNATGAKYKAPRLPVQEDVDASEFDISGIFLGMRPRDAAVAALENDFIMKDVVYNVPKFLEWKYKSVCEEEGHFILSEKNACVNEIADGKGERYISQMTFEKPSLKEKINVYFTSNFAGNFAYRVVYDAIGDYSLGTSAEPVFKKRERRKAFWRRLFTKYGWPSDSTSLVWSAGFDKASLKVTARPSTASFRLVLEDMSITDADTYKMFKENQVVIPANLFSF